MRRSRQIRLVLMTAVSLTLVNGLTKAQQEACADQLEACQPAPTTSSWWRPWSWGGSSGGTTTTASPRGGGAVTGETAGASSVARGGFGGAMGEAGG